jgi:type IV pilus assembly protein PilC
MSILMEAGVPLQEIMEILPRLSSNYVVQDSLRNLHQGLLLGDGLWRPMSGDQLFPPLMYQMIAVAEESNTLAYTMGVLAAFYETTTEERINSVLGLVAPVTTLLVAAVTAFIALSVVMPIYQLSGSIG